MAAMPKLSAVFTRTMASMRSATSADSKAARRLRRSRAIGGHLAFVNAGAAHMSTPPYLVIDGDRAVATCHTMVPLRREQGYVIARLSASRIELGREPDGRWKILHRQNWLLDGSPDGPALLARLREMATP